jgi:hypothetical protein
MFLKKFVFKNLQSKYHRRLSYWFHFSKHLYSTYKTREPSGKRKLPVTGAFDSAVRDLAEWNTGAI